MGFFSGSFKASKCKASLQMVVGRKKLQKNKKELQLKATRKAVADLLKENKLENAAIKVELVLQEENTLQAYEIIELFAELLTVRLNLIEKEKECPEDMREAVASLCFAAPLLSDLPELVTIRSQLALKYGKEQLKAMLPEHTHEDLRELCAIRTPDKALKFERLRDIVQEHVVEWDEDAVREKIMASKRGRMPSIENEGDGAIEFGDDEEGGADLAGMLAPGAQAQMQVPVAMPLGQPQAVFAAQAVIGGYATAQPLAPQPVYHPTGPVYVTSGVPGVAPTQAPMVQGSVTAQPSAGVSVMAAAPPPPSSGKQDDDGSGDGGGGGNVPLPVSPPAPVVPLPAYPVAGPPPPEVEVAEHLDLPSIPSALPGSHLGASAPPLDGESDDLGDSLMARFAALKREDE